MSRFPISYRDNPNYDAGGADAPRLLASIDLSPYGIDGRVTDLPVHVQTADAGAAQDFYTAWIAGLPLENGSLDGLSGLVDVFMKALARQERLPRYMFHVGDRAWPIYQLQGELIARYNKIHLFDIDVTGHVADNESSRFEAGEEMAVFRLLRRA